MAFGEGAIKHTNTDDGATIGTAQWNHCQLINASVADTVRWLIEGMMQSEKRKLCFASAHSLHLAQHDPYVATALRRMDGMLLDGSGTASVTRMTDERLLVTLNPRRVVPALLKAMPTGMRIFQMGSKRAETVQVANKITTTWPNLTLVGCQDSLFEEWESAALVERINRAGADIVLVGMASPRQELWMERYADKLQASLVLGVGGLFDFMANHAFDPQGLSTPLGPKGFWRLQVGGPVIEHSSAI